MILQEEPVPIRNRHYAVPEALSAAIHKALAREPADRYSDVAAMKAALSPFRNPPETSGLARP